jgi:hypothetical protein
MRYGRPTIQAPPDARVTAPHTLSVVAPLRGRSSHTPGPLSPAGPRDCGPAVWAPDAATTPLVFPPHTLARLTRCGPAAAHLPDWLWRRGRPAERGLRLLPMADALGKCQCLATARHLGPLSVGTGGRAAAGGLEARGAVLAAPIEGAPRPQRLPKPLNHGGARLARHGELPTRPPCAFHHGKRGSSSPDWHDFLPASTPETFH